MASIWLTNLASGHWADSEVTLASAALALGLFGMLFASFRYLRLEDREWQMARARYEARAVHTEDVDLLEITLAHMNQGIAFVDREGKVLIFNKRAVEYSGAEGSGSGVSRLALPMHVSDIFLAQWKNGEFGPNAELLPEEVRQYYFHGKGTLPKSYVRRRPNGTVLQVQIEPLPSGGMVQSYTDITELVAAKEAAEAGARAKSAFLATMSHEIRTPLNGVLGMAALLRRSGLSSEQIECVETIRSCGDALLGIIDDTLSFSKLETGMVEIEQVPFGLARLVNSAVRVSLGGAQAKGLELAFELDPDLPPFVRGDEKTHPPGPAQSVEQRGQVHAPWLGAPAGRRQPGERGATPAVRSDGHRDRHPGFGQRSAVQGVLAGGRQHQPPLRGNRLGAGYLQAADRGNGRGDRRHQRAGNRKHLLVRDPI